MSESEEHTWIKASDAFDKMIAAGTLPNLASEALATYLREGKIRARARALAVSKEAMLKNVWKDVKLKKDHEAIPQMFWLGNRYYHEDWKHWRWEMNRFHSTLSKDPPKRRIARKVEFCLQDLAVLQPTIFGGGVKKRRTRPPEIDKRDAVWNAVLEVIKSAHLDDDVWTKKSELKEAVTEAIANQTERSVGENQIAEVVRQAFPRIVDLRKHLDAIKAD